MARQVIDTGKGAAFDAAARAYSASPSDNDLKAAAVAAFGDAYTATFFALAPDGTETLAEDAASMVITAPGEYRLCGRSSAGVETVYFSGEGYEVKALLNAVTVASWDADDWEGRT